MKILRIIRLAKERIAKDFIFFGERKVSQKYCYEEYFLWKILLSITWFCGTSCYPQHFRR